MTRILALLLAAAMVWLPTFAFAQSAPRFDVWLSGFRKTAISAGIPAQVFDQAFADVRPNQDINDRDSNQPEFVRPIWEYLDEAVSEQRIADGQAQAALYRKTLRTIEQRYRVDSHVLLAIWGLETNFGTFRGRTNTIEALATTAYSGRRRHFAEVELLAALKILTHGDVSIADMQGSWSGAMGHMQFMPSTYLRFGVDQDGDRRKDIWSHEPEDALGSAANYLRRLDWRYGEPWGMEVALPDGFEFALSGEHDTRTAEFWNAQGVRTTTGHRVPDHGPAAIILPGGMNGPALMIFSNFQVIRKYNMSVSYAIGVGQLADRISGGGEFIGKWPRETTPLTRAKQREMQQLLQVFGFYKGAIDGMIGPQSIKAIQAYQQAIDVPADGFATVELLKLLRSKQN